MRLSREESFNVITALGRFTLNAGLMKPRRGFTLIAGEIELGADKLCEMEIPRFPAISKKKGQGFS